MVSVITLECDVSGVSNNLECDGVSNNLECDVSGVSNNFRV